MLLTIYTNHKQPAYYDGFTIERIHVKAKILFNIQETSAPLWMLTWSLTRFVQSENYFCLVCNGMPQTFVLELYVLCVT